MINNQEIANALEAFTCEKNTENHSSVPFSIKGCNKNVVHASYLVERYNICVYDGRREIEIFTVLGITSMWVLALRAMPIPP